MKYRLTSTRKRWGIALELDDSGVFVWVKDELGVPLNYRTKAEAKKAIKVEPSIGLIMHAHPMDVIYEGAEDYRPRGGIYA